MEKFLKNLNVINSPLFKTLATVSILTLNALPSCSSFEQSGLPGSASSMAKNQIMRVEPSSFGQYRLSQHLQSYPDLKYFIKQRGNPEFLAEASHHGQHYLIFYYLSQRQAFVCRNHLAPPLSLQFSGPYPISKREQKVFKKLLELPSSEHNSFSLAKDLSCNPKA